MEFIDAQRYFQSLANCSDPSTGTPVAEASDLRDRVFQEAAGCALRALEAAIDRERRIAARPANLGQPWSADEDAQLTCEFSARMSARDIATTHGRSVGAIESRLQKLGMLAVDQRTTRDRY